MSKPRSGRIAALLMSACFLGANLPLAALAQDGTGDSGTLDQGTTNYTPPQDLTLPTGGGATNTTPTPVPAGTDTSTTTTTTSPAPAVVGATDKPHVSSPAKPVVRPAVSKPATRPASNTPVQGRIEELIQQPGAILPLRALTPKMDTSKPKTTMLKGEVQQIQAATQTNLSASTSQQKPVVQSFPTDYSGTWGGNLTVWTAEYGPLAWQFDPDEARQELNILRKGNSGSVSFNFVSNGGKVSVEPTQVIFTVNSTVNTGQLASQLGGSGANAAQSQALAALLGGGGGTMVIPKMYAMHLGNLGGGIGVTGNYLQSRIAKNEIRELKPGVLEQTIVTRDSDTNSKSGKVRQSYSENVLRFTKVNRDQLYVQVAMVKYNVNGKFENKSVLYGTVTRGQGGMGLPSMIMPGMGQSGGGGQLGGMDQIMREMNKMLGGQ